MGFQGLRRRPHVLHPALDELVGRKAFGERLVGGHQAVTEHIRHEVGHVFGQRVIAPAQARERASAAIAALPESVNAEYPVIISDALRELSEKTKT